MLSSIGVNSLPILYILLCKGTIDTSANTCSAAIATLGPVITNDTSTFELEFYSFHLSTAESLDKKSNLDFNMSFVKIICF